jgi:hypothetical protein
MPLDPARHYARNPRAVAIMSGTCTLWSLPGEPVFRSTAVPSATVAVVWELLATPIPGSVLAAHVAAAPDPTAFEHLVDRLITQAFVLRGAPDELANSPVESTLPKSATDLPCPHLVLGVTGAVQAAFVGPVIRRLALDFATRMDVILTRSARRFITTHAAAALGVTVWHDPFERREGIRVPHAALAAAAPTSAQRSPPARGRSRNRHEAPPTAPEKRNTGQQLANPLWCGSVRCVLQCAA